MADPGIGVGTGGFFASMMNPELASRVAQHLTPNPNLLAQQGQGAQPGAVDGQGNPVGGGSPPGANLAPSASTQPDPVNASYIADLMKYRRVSAAADDLNRNIQGMAAGFGTAQQQASKRQALGSGGGVGGGLADLAGMQKMQDVTIQDNVNARFMANAHIFGETLRAQGVNVTDAQATEIMNGGKPMQEQFTGAAAGNAGLTNTQKDAEAATRAWADAHKDATPQEIADYKANLIAGGMGGNDLETRQYLDEKRNGLTTDDIATWKAKKAAQAAGMVTEAKNVKDFQDTAKQEYSASNSKLMSVQTAIDILDKDPDAAQAALQSFQPTTGKWAAIDPFQPQKVKDAAGALQKLQSSLSADQLASVKNVRNQREFSTLGQAANAGLQAAASPEDFRKGLDDIKNKFLDAQATLELTVGHRLTGKLVGHGSQDLLDKKNPYFNGGSQENDFREMSESDADAAFAKLPAGARYVGPDGVPRTK